MHPTIKKSVRSVPNTTSVEDIISILAEDGGVIIKEFLTTSQVRAFNADIEPTISATPLGPKMQISEEWTEFHGVQTKRITDVIRLSKTFREEILDLDLLHALGDAVFLENIGTYWLTATQVIEIGPGQKPQPLHRDIGGWPIFHSFGVGCPEILTNFLVALTDFTEENGATRIIPGSNTWADFGDQGTQEMTVPIEMKAGDAVFFSGKVVHGGGSNTTQNEHRRALTIPLMAGFLTPEDAFPFMVELEVVRALPERVQRLLGFRSHYPVGGAPLWKIDTMELGEYLDL